MGKQNNIQKKLRGSEGELPQEYSWENMQEGIFAKMEQVTTQTVAPINEKKKRKFLPLILFFGLFLLTVSAYLLLDQSNQESDKLTTQTKQNTETKVNNKEASPSNTKVTESANLNNPITPDQESNESQPVSDNPSGIKEVITVDSRREIDNSKITKSIDRTKVHSEVTHSNHLTESSAKATSSFKANNSQLPSVILPSQSNQKNTTLTANNEQVAHLGMIALLQSTVDYTFTLDEETLNTNLINLSNENLEEQKEKNRLKLIASIGGNLYSHNYSGSDLAQARTTNLSAIIGQSASLSVEYPLNQRWALQTGLTIDRSLTKLDYTGVMDTIIKADVTNHNHNNASGIVSTTVSEKDINGTFVTDVILYNKYLSLGLPISVKRYFSLGKLDLGIGAGLEYNYRFIKSGRYLVEPSGISPDYQLRSHSKDDSFNSHLLNGLVSLNLDYQLNNGVGIGLGIDGTYGITDAVSDQAISSHPVRTRGNLRLFKVF